MKLLRSTGVSWATHQTSRSTHTSVAGRAPRTVVSRSSPTRSPGSPPKAHHRRQRAHRSLAPTASKATLDEQLDPPPFSDDDDDEMERKDCDRRYGAAGRQGRRASKR